MNILVSYCVYVHVALVHTSVYEYTHIIHYQRVIILILQQDVRN